MRQPAASSAAMPANGRMASAGTASRWRMSQISAREGVLASGYFSSVGVLSNLKFKPARKVL
jgi:hypothetical protein